MDQSIEQMTRDLARAGYAKGTQDAYVAVAKKFGEFVDKPIAQATRDELRAFLDAREARGKSTSQRRNEMCALLFLFRRTLGHPELVSFIKLPKRSWPLPTVLSLEEVHTLLRAIQSPRYQALAMVMYGAGLRISEAISLQVGDIDGRRNVIRVRHGKGNKAREAKLSPSLYTWLRSYWNRERPLAPWLFASRQGELPCKGTIRKAIALAAKAAWIPKRVTPHTLRHSFATHLLDEGYDTHVIRELLGHTSITSTARYARVTQKRMRETPSPLDRSLRGADPWLPQGQRASTSQTSFVPTEPSSKG